MRKRENNISRSRFPLQICINVFPCCAASLIQCAQYPVHFSCVPTERAADGAAGIKHRAEGKVGAPEVYSDKGTFKRINIITELENAIPEEIASGNALC